MRDYKPNATLADIIDYLLTHNKNYTKTQYYYIVDIAEKLKNEGLI